MSFGLRDIFDAAVNITPTKRNILSAVGSVYVPTGYIQPIAIKLKLLFQEVCLMNVSWDEVIGEQLLQKWMIIIIIENLTKCIDFVRVRTIAPEENSSPVMVGLKGNVPLRQLSQNRF